MNALGQSLTRLKSVGKRGDQEPFQKRLQFSWELNDQLIPYSLGSHHVPRTVLGTKYTLIGQTEITVIFIGPRAQKDLQ